MLVLCFFRASVNRPTCLNVQPLERTNFHADLLKNLYMEYYIYKFYLPLCLYYEL